MLPLLLVVGVIGSALWIAKGAARTTRRALWPLLPELPAALRGRAWIYPAPAQVDRVRLLDDAARRALQAQLQARGFYRGPIDGRYSGDLSEAYIRWLDQPGTRWTPRPPAYLGEGLASLQAEYFYQLLKEIDPVAAERYTRPGPGAVAAPPSWSPPPSGRVELATAELTALTAALRARGCFTGADEGYWGPKTDAAVACLLRRHGETDQHITTFLARLTPEEARRYAALVQSGSLDNVG
jgi:hypothetical protein